MPGSCLNILWGWWDVEPSGVYHGSFLVSYPVREVYEFSYTLLSAVVTHTPRG